MRQVLVVAMCRDGAVMACDAAGWEDVDEWWLEISGSGLGGAVRTARGEMAAGRATQELHMVAAGRVRLPAALYALGDIEPVRTSHLHARSIKTKSGRKECRPMILIGAGMVQREFAVL